MAEPIVNADVPNTDPIADVRERVRVLLDGGVAQAEAAREAGLSTSALSRWLKGRYEGDNGAVETKLLKWVEARAAQTGFLLPEGPGWIATRTGERVVAALTYGQQAADLVVIYGSAGLGKTVSARHYAATHPNVWIARMRPATATLSACLAQLYRSVFGKPAPRGGSPSGLEQMLIERLQGTRGLLVIDEAQHLGVPALETVRGLHDETEIGLALVGNEYVYARLSGNGNSAIFAQIYSRVGKRVSLRRPQADDVDTLAAGWGVAERDALAFLRKVSAAPGALRGVVKTVRLASMLATGAGEALDVAHLKAAWRELGREVS